MRKHSNLRLSGFALFLLTLVSCTSKENILQASGIIEATEITVASQTGGQIAEIWVKEGDQVKQGDLLFQIEDPYLAAQLKQAAGVFETAQANYDLIAKGMLAEQRQAAIAAAELEVTSAQYNLNQLHETYLLDKAEILQNKKDAKKSLEDLLDNDLRQALAEKAVADAQKAVEDAEKRLNIEQSQADQSDIDSAWAQVIITQKALEDAQEDFEEYANKPDDNLARATYKAKLSAAEDQYDAAVRRYNGMKSTGNKTDIELAEADLATAKARLAKAQRDWEDAKEGPDAADVAYLEALSAHYDELLLDLQDGPDPDDLALVEARLTYAQAQLELAQAEQPTPEQLAIAQAEVETARANLEAAQVQIERLQILAPISGSILSSSIEPGEIIQPGGAALTIGELGKLTVTVYIPEDRYGRLALGGEAALSVDSFPGTTFQAYITRIADLAEYTPRNVQTQEDRVTTVYAVELEVSNPEGVLKPGMPADVIFTP